MPRVLTGSLHASNKGAIDWGWQGLLAFGSQSSVVVVHPDSVRNIQTLEGHKAPVTKVKWSRENYPHEYKNNPYHLRLASADSLGFIVVWDVVTALQRSCFYDATNKLVGDMAWLPWQDASKDFLLVLHPPYTVILWNADSGEKIWKKSYTDVLDSFSLDPFCLSNVAFLTRSGNLMLVDDFSLSKNPSSNGQTFRISSLSSQGSSTNVSALEVEERSKNILSMGAKIINRQMQRIGGPEKTRDDQPSNINVEETCPCIQITYFPAARNILLLVYPKEVLFLDTNVLQTLAHVMLDRNVSPFLQALPCAQRECVYFVQEHGCVTLRILNCKNSSSSSQKSSNGIDVYNPMEVQLESVCSPSESIRVTKAYRVHGVALSPSSERHVALLMSNGRILLNELTEDSDCYSPTKSMSDLIKLQPDLTMTPAKNLRFVMNGFYSSLGQNPTVIRSQPSGQGGESSASEWIGRNLIGVGTADGCIQLVDPQKGEVIKDFNVHSCPIRCMEWGGPLKVISTGYSQALSTSTVVRNELFITDIRTGLTKVIRPETEESPIDMIRVSFYYSYLAVAFRDQPMEVWDLKHLRLLRRMSKSCPVIIDMAWSGKHHQARILKTTPSVSDDRGIDGPTSPTQVSGDGDKMDQTIYRENLVVLDNENHLYHVVVKGMHVRDGKEVNTQWATTSQVNAMVWKDDYLAFGDNEGRISVWDLSSKQSKASPVQRGAVKRLQFSRIPGDYTLAVLHSDGVSLWNAAKFVHLHQLAVPKDLHVKVVDLDVWGDAAAPAVLTADGSLRVFDATVTLQTAPVSDSLLQETHCPALLPPGSTSILKCLLRDDMIKKIYGSEEDRNLVDIVRRLDISESEKELLLTQLDEEEEYLSEFCDRSFSGTACRRNLNISRWIGDEWESQIWSVLDYCTGDNVEGSPNKSLGLPLSYDLIWNKSTFLECEKRRCAWFDSRRASYEQMGIIVEKLILLGHSESAVQLLLNADSSQAEYYQDSLKACLLSAVHSSTECQSTVKLVATNLIANGKLSEGTQLLCLIGKHYDACRYLQSSGSWFKAAWLAKVSLKETEYAEIMKKWIEHLLAPQVCLKSLALLLTLSLRDWERSLEMLLTLRQVGTAVLLLNLIGKDKVSKQIVEDVYGEYARELENLGLNKAALHYCDLAGERGANIRKEIEILIADSPSS